MAKVPYLDPEELAEEDRDLLVRPVNLFRAMCHSREGTRRFLGIADWIRHESKLDPRLRELAILQVGYLLRSRYEYSHHLKIGRDFGVTDEDVRAIERESAGEDSGLPALERTVLRAAREITGGLRPGEQTMEALQEALDHERLVELALIISFYSAVVRFLETMEIDVEPDYQAWLDRSPLPGPR